MNDCPNVEMRELLPDRIAELLPSGEAARVDAHLASCEMCTYEVTVLRAARATMQRRGQLDVQRVSLAVASATRAGVPARRPSRASTWGGWRAAASIALVAVGATSVAVWNNAGSAPRDSVVAVSTPAATNAGATTNAGTGTGANAGAASTTRGLSVAGGLSDLSDTELESLLGEIGTIETANVAEPEDVLPVINTAEGAR